MRSAVRPARMSQSRTQAAPRGSGRRGCTGVKDVDQAPDGERPPCGKDVHLGRQRVRGDEPQQIKSNTAPGDARGRPGGAKSCQARHARTGFAFAISEFVFLPRGSETESTFKMIMVTKHAHSTAPRVAGPSWIAMENADRSAGLRPLAAHDDLGEVLDVPAVILRRVRALCPALDDAVPSSEPPPPPAHVEAVAMVARVQARVRQPVQQLRAPLGMPPANRRVRRTAPRGRHLLARTTRVPRTEGCPSAQTWPITLSVAVVGSSSGYLAPASIASASLKDS